MNSVKTWLHGLLGAAIGGAASVGSGFVVGVGWQKIGQMAAVSAVVSASLYLTKSPIWSTTTTTKLIETPDTSTIEVVQKES